MSSTIRIKRRATGASGAPSTLKTAEIAYNMVDGYFYVGYGDDGSGNATSVKTFSKDDFSTNYRVPAGGTTNQVLAKSSSSDYALAWATANTYTNGTGLTLTGSTFAVDETVIAALASPTFTGTPAAPTATTADSSTK